MKTIILSAVLLLSFSPPQDPAPYPPPPPDVSPVARITQNEEPGTPLTITGTVYRSDRKTPYGGLVLFIYQTDARGVYNKTDGSYLRPRLHGWIKTDGSGKYKLRTIKPGPYPGGNQPAHIHITFKPSGGRPRWLEDFLFSDDPNLTASQRALPRTLGTFSPVLVLSREADGMLVGRRDIVVADEP
ncbi:MAG: hypothetical protein HBSIN02_17850 [Bacteroidia bacterium]|nr:MAG: hypothetical protein HBSIN02_17850 [Bacteroidia bacterium]